MKKFGKITVLIIFMLFSIKSVYSQQTGVAVFAHSISTSREARDVIRQTGWVEVPLKQADFILVVCRSGLSFPLNSSYRNISDLDRAADSQLNISGSNFHVYLYRINNDLSVSEVDHKKYPAE